MKLDTVSAADSEAAIAEGPSIQAEASRLVSLAKTLQYAAERSPQKGVRYIHPDGMDHFQTYPELVEESLRMLGALREKGLLPGDKIIFQLDRNEDFVPAFWACQMGGFVPVPTSIPPSYEAEHSALSKLENAWIMLEKPVVLTSSDLASSILDFADRRNLENFRVEAVEPLRDGTQDHNWHDNDADDLCLLLLTSGSTGQPKGVQLNHRNLLSRSAATSEFDQFNENDVSLNWMPLDHVGGLVMYHIRDVFIGCDQIQAPTDLILQNPLTWLDWTQRFKISITWAPNFAFGLVNDQAEAIESGEWDLSSLRFILNGGEAIVSKTARRFVSLLSKHGLPSTAMRPAWGMSETSSGVTSSHIFNLENTNDNDPYVAVGAALPGTTLRIIDLDEKTVKQGEIGSLQVKGPTITCGYYNNPDLNDTVFNSEGWFATGDLGFIKSGQLTITGRDKDDIIINGVNFNCHEIESVVEDVDGVEVSFAAATAIRQMDEDTDRIAIFFSPSQGFEDRIQTLIKTIRSAVAKKEGVTPDYILPVEKSSIPKTSIGKIQRSQLRKRFETGGFDELISEYGEAKSPKSGDLPDWFFDISWRDSPIGGGSLPENSSILILADSTGISDTLVKGLKQDGHTVTIVKVGETFQASEDNCYTLTPQDPKHYNQLLESLDKIPEYIIHLWTVNKCIEIETASDLEVVQKSGAYSLLGLIQALAKANNEDKAIKVLVASEQIQSVFETDVINFAPSPILGLVRTIPQEFDWLDCHHVDLYRKNTNDEAAQILAELKAWENNVESAWRENTRKVPYLEKARNKSEFSELPLEKGGIYLLSGGLGGVAEKFASYLQDNYDAKLLLIGRSNLPPEDQWDQRIATNGAMADSISNLKFLKNNGEFVEYAAIDLGDVDNLKQKVLEVENLWGRKLSGILHLAGIYYESQLTNESIDGLSKVMRPKVEGTWNLHQIASERENCLVVSFSSLISYFGSLSTGSYAAANNFLDSFANYQRNNCGLLSYNLLWGSWTQTGMSRGVEAGEALRTRGYLPISPKQGVESLLFAMRNKYSQLLVGIDGNNRSIQRYFHPEEAAALDAARSNEEAGEIYVEPKTEVEKQIAKIWEEILDVPRIGLNDNFFEMGGRSLLAAKMFASINKVLGKNLPVPALFKAPTVAQISFLFLEQPKSSKIKITALRISGERVPLFIVPGAGADGSSIKGLAEELGEQQPCFALQLKDLASKVAFGKPASIDDTAKLLAAEINALEPKSPIQLGAVGFGIVLVWKTAEILAESGRSITKITLFNPPPSAFFEPAAAGSETQYEFSRPATSNKGLLGRLFKKKEISNGVTKSFVQERERYGDFSFKKLQYPVSVFAEGTEESPWKELSRTGFKLNPITTVSQSFHLPEC